MAEAFLATLALAALALAATGYLTQRLRLPPVLGYLVAGLLLSPHALGGDWFPQSVMDGVAELGVLFLLFLVGLELDLEKLRRTIRATAAVLPFDLLVPIVAAGAVARALGWSFPEALVLGLVVALSSTIIGERLTSSPSVSQGARHRVIGVLISEDVAAGALLALLAAMGSGAAATAEGGLQVVLATAQLVFFLVLLTVGGLILVPRILDEVARRHVHELMVLSGAALVILWGYLGFLAGSSELGAFVAGVAAAEAGSRFVTRNAMQSLRDAAVALFFFASGLATSVGALAGDPVPALAVAGVFLVGKVLVHAPAALASGLSLVDALRTAFALGALGEFSLILAAVAQREGLAHPALHGTVVGAMLVLLPVAAILLRAAPALERGFYRLPDAMQGPLVWLVTGLRRLQPSGPAERGRRRTALQGLAGNILLLMALAALTPWLASRAVAWVDGDPLLVAGVTWGLGFALALPLLLGAYRHYRSLVWSLVGLRPGERIGAGRARTRLVDVWVAASAVLVLALVSLRIPATLPVLGAAVVVAAVVATVAWRQLRGFQRTLEDTVTRVLGRETESGRLLDQVLQKYPWGVRSTAVSVPPDSPLARRTIEGSRLGELTGALVAVIHRRNREIVNPPPDTLILPGDTLMLLGDLHQIARAEALVVAHGDALRMATTSKQVVVEEVALEADSPWVGRPLSETGLRDETGALVAGVWPREARHPQPFDPDRLLRDGDRLLVVGTRLQVERVADVARAHTDED